MSSTVESIGESAFSNCDRLEYADLRAAHGLRRIRKHAFGSCSALRHVKLNDGLERIRKECFSWSELEEVVIPGSVRCIEQQAFRNSHLKRVRFLGTTEGTNTDTKLPIKYSSSETEEDSSESGQQLVIG